MVYNKRKNTARETEMNNYKKELQEKYGKAYTVAIMKTARRLIDGKHTPYEVSEELALATVAVLVDRNKGQAAVNKPETIDYRDLRALEAECKISTNKIDGLILFTY